MASSFSTERQPDAAAAIMETAKTEEAYKAAAAKFAEIPGFRDANALAKQCVEEAEKCRRIAEENRRIAEENRRIAEENRRIAEEKKKKRVAAVVAALKGGSGAKKEPKYEEKLAASKARIESLTALRNGFDQLLDQASKLQQEQAAVASQEANLSALRAKLGLFAGKEKKRIDESLSALAAKKRELADRIGQNAQQRCGFNSKMDIDQEIAKETAVESELEAQIESWQANEGKPYSYEEAVKAYLGEPEMTRAVNAVFPATSIVLYLQGKTNSLLFGNYIQKVNGSPEPIEWQMLKRENGRILVISKYPLDFMPCEKEDDGDRTIQKNWENSFIRSWLNGEFIEHAFTDAEKQLILKTTIDNALYGGSICKNEGLDGVIGSWIKDENQDNEFECWGDKCTDDKVFFLNYAEIRKYFPEQSARTCKAKDNLRKKDSITSPICEDDGEVAWWTRSYRMVSEMRWAHVGRCIGGVFEGDGATFLGAVRPAMWIETTSD